MADDHAAILRIMNDYCRFIDAGDLDGYANLFEHGVFRNQADENGGERGAAEVLAMVQNVTLYDGIPNTKHALSNVQIDVEVPGQRATAQSYITVSQAVPPDFPLQPIFIGHYLDTFEVINGDWCFTIREISNILMGDLSHHRPDLTGG